MAKKDQRPKINPSNCVQSLDAYFDTQSQLRNMLPEAIKMLREIGNEAATYVADIIEKHNTTLQEFHSNYAE